MTDRPVLAGALGALVIAFSAILVRAGRGVALHGGLFRCFYALPLLGPLAWYRAAAVRAALRARPPARPGGRRVLAADLTFWHHSIEAVGAGLATVLGNVQVVLVG